MAEGLFRVWAFLVYPQSAPDHWLEILKDRHIPLVISPLHDKDIDKDGSIKKAHYHCMFIFEGKKSFKQIKEITDSINQPIPIAVDEIGAMVRYFIHLDDKDKYQYPYEELKCFAGADIAKYFMPSYTKTNSLLQEIEEFIVKNDIKEYATLCEYAQVNEQYTWMPLLRNGYTMYLNNYIKSRRYRAEHTKVTDNQINVNSDGEVL